MTRKPLSSTRTVCSHRASTRTTLAPPIYTRAPRSRRMRSQCRPCSIFNTGSFPTRSHCHAWSSSPLWFYIRIIPGARSSRPGGRAIEISPWVKRNTKASGAFHTINGPVFIKWARSRKRLSISVKHPRQVRPYFRANRSTETLEVDFRSIPVDPACSRQDS